MALKEAPEALVKALVAHLKTNMTSLVDLYADYPSAEDKLSYPSGSVTIGNPVFEPIVPYVYSKGTEVVVGSVITAPVVRAVGNWVFRLQVDIWCKSKAQRHKIEKEFFLGFNSDSSNRMGASLQLTDYFDAWARYSMTGMKYGDGEEQSQRGEWKLTVSILADCRAFIEKDEHIIKTIENTLETPQDIVDVELDPPTQTI